MAFWKKPWRSCRAGDMLTDFRVRQREYLLQISRAMTAHLELGALLRLILEASVEILDGQAGLIALREEEGAFAVRASYGLPSQLLHLFGPLMPDSDSSDPATWAVAEIERKLSVVANAVGLSLRQVVGLPLSMADDLVGAIYVFRVHGNRFSTNDRQILQSFAEQAAIAVNNARLYQELAGEKRRLDAIIEFSADGIVILDPAQRIVSFNRSLARITGVSPAEAVGREHGVVIVVQNKRAGKTLEEASAGGWPLAGQAGARSGSTLYVEGELGQTSVEISYAPLFDREGRLVNIIGSVRDITRFREAEQLKSTFISVISHELKTPVALIKGYAGTLRREDAQWDVDTVRQSAAVIEEEADRLTRLINNLLDASRLQAGGLKLQKSDVRLDQLAARLVDKFRTQTDKHLLSVDFPDDFPLVQADAARLEQVLSNLVDNALKYSPRGGTVRVAGRVLPSEVIISVSDEGIGIPLEEHARVFERFYRVDDTLSSRVQGSGLGLYLTKAVVEAHGGRVWVESQPGHGACFSFALPRS
jgi:PAS domain S-box-containing protein